MPAGFLLMTATRKTKMLYLNYSVQKTASFMELPAMHCDFLIMSSPGLFRFLSNAQRGFPSMLKIVFMFQVRCMYTHLPKKKEQAKRELLKYADGNKNERYEVCEALSYKGGKSDIEFLKNLLDDPDMDVRVSAANAVIRIERREHRGLRWLDWTVIGAYILFMLGIGWYYSRRQKSTEDYFLGGRNIHPILSGLSLFATLLSTISYLAYPGEMIKHGPIVFLGYVPAFLVSYLLVGYFMIPLFMKLKITSAYEILEKPLGVSVRLCGSIMFLLTRIVWMALLLFLTAKAMVVMMNWDESLIPYIALAGGIITVIYSSMGGLKAVITTDVTQFIILLLGAVLTVALITAKMGGVGAWFPTEWAPTWDKFVFFSADSHIRVTIVGTFVATILWWICTAGSDQMAIQRYLATRDVRSARKALLTSGIADIGVL